MTFNIRRLMLAVASVGIVLAVYPDSSPFWGFTTAVAIGGIFLLLRKNMLFIL